MPTYQFLCKKCKKHYDDIVPYDETGKYTQVSCPNCNSKKKEKIFSPCTIIFAQPEGTSKMDNFSYRAGHNLEKAKSERRNAESKSHMGKAPYRPINDLNML